MAKKSIIVDSVDVSVCPEFAVSHDGGIPCGYFCKDTPDCSFKLKARLERKERECEEFQTLAKTHLVDYFDIVKKCEELKKEVDYSHGQNIRWSKVWFKMWRQRNLYLKALDEIAEYQKRNCETCTGANTSKCNHDCQVFVILNIINGLKGGNGAK